MSSYRNAPLSTGQDFRDLSLPLSLYRGIRHVSRHYIPNLLTSAQGAKQQFTRLRRGEWQWRSFLSLPTTLILIWILALWWGEVRTFRTCIDRCDWQTWERWVGFCKSPVIHELELTQYIARECLSTSYGPRRGPPAGRSAHLSRSPLAAVHRHSIPYRLLYAQVLHASTKPPGPYIRFLPRRPV